MSVMSKPSFIDRSTRVIIIEFTVYQRLIDYFMTVEAMVELSISGVVSPTSLKIYSYRPNAFDLSQDTGLHAADILRLLLCFHLAYGVYRKFKDEALPKSGLVVSALIDGGIIALFIAAWVIRYFLSGQTTAEILANARGSFVELNGKAQWYHEPFIIDSVALLLLMLRGFSIFRINRHINFILQILDKVSSKSSLQILGDMGDPAIHARSGSMLRRFHVHCLPDVWSVRVYLPHILLRPEVGPLLHLRAA